MGLSCDYEYNINGERKTTQEKVYSVVDCEERKRNTRPYIFSSSGLGRRRILGVAVTATVDKEIRKSLVSVCQQHVGQQMSDEALEISKGFKVRLENRNDAEWTVNV